MKIEALIRDRYNREARLAPALLVALPAALVLFAWLPALRSIGPALIALLGFCGGIVWLSHLARDRGKALEPKLFQAWGGMPSTAMLRHRDGRLSGPLKGRYKSRLRSHLPDLDLPTLEVEANDPAAADAIYEAAGAWLLAQTRDRTRFRLIFEENVNYGFRRNFWALKPFALLVGAGSLIGSGAVMGSNWYRLADPPTVVAAIATALTALYVLFVAARVNRDWVRLSAEAFAGQLLAACDTLPVNNSKGHRSGGRAA